MEKKIRVLHVLVSNQFSGAENVVCQIINMFRQEDKIEMIYCSPDGPIRDALSDRGVVFAPMKAATPAELKRVISETKPTVIHAHDMRASFLTALTCGKIPFVSHIHNNNFDSRRPTVKAVLFRMAAWKAKHVFWVSEAARKGYYFCKGLEAKSSVLYNVIDVNQLRQKADAAEKRDAYDIVYLGRLTYPKHPERLIEVLDEIVRRNPKITAAIIGSGDLEQQTLQEIEKRGLNKNVHALGFMTNPYGILKNAKVMIMTSRWEGLPMCALESLALGVPIISTPTDGLRELIIPGKTGFLSDDNGEMAEKIIECVEDSELRAKLSANINAQVEKLMDISAYRDRLLKQYSRRSIE